MRLGKPASVPPVTQSRSSRLVLSRCCDQSSEPSYTSDVWACSPAGAWCISILLATQLSEVQRPLWAQVAAEWARHRSWAEYEGKVLLVLRELLHNSRAKGQVFNASNVHVDLLFRQVKAACMHAQACMHATPTPQLKMGIACVLNKMHSQASVWMQAGQPSSDV